MLRCLSAHVSLLSTNKDEQQEQVLSPHVCIFLSVVVLNIVVNISRLVVLSDSPLSLLASTHAQLGFGKCRTALFTIESLTAVGIFDEIAIAVFQKLLKLLGRGEG